MSVTNDELACVYAALICHDEGLEVTADKISAITKAAELNVEAFYPTLFAKYLKTAPLAGLISNVGGGAAEAAPAQAAAGGDAAPVEEKKAAAKAPEPSEEDEDMGFGLFD